jgi:hypothetical protein
VILAHSTDLELRFLPAPSGEALIYSPIIANRARLPSVSHGVWL